MSCNVDIFSHFPTPPALRFLKATVKSTSNKQYLLLRCTHLLVGLRSLLSENGYAGGKRVDQGLQRNTRDETAKYQERTIVVQEMDARKQQNLKPDALRRQSRPNC
jgi:hypothetical protein